MAINPAIPAEATVINAEEALAILAEHGGYGSVRVYGIIAEGEECAGQMTAVKSKYHVEEKNLAVMYALSNDGSVPIRKA